MRQFARRTNRALELGIEVNYIATAATVIKHKIKSVKRTSKNKEIEANQNETYNFIRHTNLRADSR